MELGLIGLGRMGGNMRDRVRAAGHEVIGYDPRSDVTDVPWLGELVKALTAPRVVWVMVPSGEPTRSSVRSLADNLEPGDLVIDGRNSRYTDDAPKAVLLSVKGVGYVDRGESAGIWVKANGYGLMAGGSAEHIALAMPIFDALRPEGLREEGFELMEAAPLITNVPAVIQAWLRGTVVPSWLLNLLVNALQDDPHLAGLEGYVGDSGEAGGRSRRPSSTPSRCR